MAHVQFTDVPDRPMEFLDVPSLTLDEFQQLVPPFEAAFHAHMAAWRLDGQPRTARRFSVYNNCPLPTPEDRLLFILAYVKTYSLQVVQGRLFGMGQSKANQWIHVLLPVLLATLRTRVYWQKGGNLRGLLSGCYDRLGRLAFLDRCWSLRYRVIHRLKAWHLECVSYSPNHDLVPPSRLEGCPQMHQATDSGFPPK